MQPAGVANAMFNTIQRYPANHLNPAHTVHTEWDGQMWSCKIIEADDVICEVVNSSRVVGDIRAQIEARKLYREILAARDEATLVSEEVTA